MCESQYLQSIVFHANITICVKEAWDPSKTCFVTMIVCLSVRSTSFVSSESKESLFAPSQSYLSMFSKNQAKVTKKKIAFCKTEGGVKESVKIDLNFWHLITSRSQKILNAFDVFSHKTSISVTMTVFLTSWVTNLAFKTQHCLFLTSWKYFSQHFCQNDSVSDEIIYFVRNAVILSETPLFC